MNICWAIASGADRNPDTLPDAPTAGCPRCGSAWVEVDEYGVEARLMLAWSITSYAPLRWVAPIAAVESFSPRPIVAARMVCADGHVITHEFQLTANAGRCE